MRQTRTLGSARGPPATAVSTATLKRNAGPARCWTLGQLSRYWAVGSLLGVEAAVRFLANEAPGFRPVPTVRTPQGTPPLSQGDSAYLDSDLRWYYAMTPNQTAPSKWVLIAFAVSRRFLRPFITSIGANSLKMPFGVISSS